MLNKAISIIEDASRNHREAMLFHSATGKDSIALLNLLSPRFDKIYCIFMYTVKGLYHIEKYIKYAEKRYSNIEFVQTPHYAVYSYIKIGHLGTRKDVNQKQYSLANIDELMRIKTGCKISFYGFKQSDSLNRRLMLRTYRMNAICDKSGKYYPLSEWVNDDVISYIRRENLIEPIRYGKGQSQGCNINDKDFLVWCNRNYPNDIAKITKVYPEVSILINKYENQPERNGSYQ